jgi:hypothetical protein
VREFLRWIADEERPLVEFKPHSTVYRCPTAVNLWIVAGFLTTKTTSFICGQFRMKMIF